MLADLDGRKKTLEIVATAVRRHVYAWRPDGTPLPGWLVLQVDRTQMASMDAEMHHVVPKVVDGTPLALHGTKILSTPAAGPLPGDGTAVVVVSDCNSSCIEQWAGLPLTTLHERAKKTRNSTSPSREGDI